MKASEIIISFVNAKNILNELFGILNVEYLDLSCEEFEILINYIDNNEDNIQDIMDTIDSIIEDLLPALDIDSDCEEFEDDDDE